MGRMNHLKQIVFGLLIAVFLLQCLPDAPRVNALDPIHADNRTTISGKVQQLDGVTPIEGASLMLQPGDLLTRSDANGDYFFEITDGDGSFMLSCTANSYSGDTLALNLDRGEAAVADFSLNALPRFQRTSLLSDNEASFQFQLGRRYLNISAQVNDPDGANSIQTVWCEWPEFGIRDTLRWAPMENAYVSRPRESQLGVETLGALVGKPAFFYAEDQQGSIGISEAQTLRRVIWTIPIGDGPIEDTTQPFDFQWTRPDTIGGTRFPLTYTIEIYIDSPVFFPPEDVISGLPVETTSVTYNNPALQAGESYFWVLYFVDEFGNRSRSLQNGLIIL